MLSERDRSRIIQCYLNDTAFFRKAIKDYLTYHASTYYIQLPSGELKPITPPEVERLNGYIDEIRKENTKKYGEYIKFGDERTA